MFTKNIPNIYVNLLLRVKKHPKSKIREGVTPFYTLCRIIKNFSTLSIRRGEFFMNVKQFYIDGYKIFNTQHTPYFTQDVIQTLNETFLRKYKHFMIDVDFYTQDEVDKCVTAVLKKNTPYYEGIFKSYLTDFETLKTTNINETHTNTSDVEKSSELTITGEKTNTKDLTSTTTDNTTSTTNNSGTITYNSTISDDKKLTENISNLQTDTRTDDLKESDTETITNTNTKDGTNTKSKNAYESTTPESMTKDTQDIISETLTGENSKIYAKMNTGTLTNEIDGTSTKTVTDGNVSEKTGTDSDTLDSTTHNTGTTTDKHTGTDKYSTSDTNSESTLEKLSESGNKTQTGYMNIDFKKAIEDIYETRKINIYDIVCDDVFKFVCIPIYECEF